MKPQDAFATFSAAEAAKLAAVADDRQWLEQLLLEALLFGRQDATAYLMRGQFSESFPPPGGVRGGAALLERDLAELLVMVARAAAEGDDTQLRACTDVALRRPDVSLARVPRAELARWLQHHAIDSAYDFGPAPTARVAGLPLQHSTKRKKRDEVDVFLDAALAQVGDGADVALVWSTLQTMARQPSKPAQWGTLLGFAEDQGLQYERSGKVRYLSRDALAKRLSGRQP